MSSFSILLMTIAVTAPAIEDPGVTAAELIADVRASEQWIHDVKSLVLRFEGTWTRTPAGIAQERNVFERRFPDMEINEDRFPSLRPTMSETVIIGFSMDQLYYEAHWPDQRYERKYFDGTQSIMVDGSDPDKIDNYVFDGMPGPSRDVWDGFLRMDLSWLQAALHSFW